MTPPTNRPSKVEGEMEQIWWFSSTSTTTIKLEHLRKGLPKEAPTTGVNRHLVVFHTNSKLWSALCPTVGLVQGTTQSVYVTVQRGGEGAEAQLEDAAQGGYLLDRENCLLGIAVVKG